jgi:hypothetical protein
MRPVGAGLVKARNHAGGEGSRRAADRFAANVMPAISDIRDAGITSYSGIARELNAREIRTRAGRKWYAATVRNVLMRSA